MQLRVVAIAINYVDQKLKGYFNLKTSMVISAIAFNIKTSKLLLHVEDSEQISEKWLHTSVSNIAK